MIFLAQLSFLFFWGIAAFAATDRLAYLLIRRNKTLMEIKAVCFGLVLFMILAGMLLYIFLFRVAEPSAACAG